MPPGLVENSSVPLPRSISFLIELVERLAIPQGATADAEVFVITIQRQGVCCVSLNLDCVCPAFLCQCH